MASGDPALRLVWDTRAINHFMKNVIQEPQGFVYQTSLQRVVVESGQEMLFSGENLVPSFLLLKLPDVRKTIRGGDVGKPITGGCGLVCARCR